MLTFTREAYQAGLLPEVVSSEAPSSRQLLKDAKYGVHVGPVGALHRHGYFVFDAAESIPVPSGGGGNSCFRVARALRRVTAPAAPISSFKKNKPNMKTNFSVIIAALACAAITAAQPAQTAAETPQPNEFAAALASYQAMASPAFTGAGLYAKQLAPEAAPRTYSLTEYDVTPLSGSLSF